MTAISWSTVLDHSSDAGFRAWGAEINAKFVSVGLVQTADTGQINWTTVTRPAINTVGGYEIWTLPGGALTFKIEYGSGNPVAVPSMWLTVGTGSNGSGTITGQSSTRTQNGFTTSNVASTVTAYQSYLCVTTAFFGFAWKEGSSGTANTPRTFWAIGLTVNSSGVVSNVGYYVKQKGNQTTCTIQVVRTLATAATRNVTGSYCVFPGQPTVSSDGTNNQVYLDWLDTPGVQPALYTGMVVSSELTLGNTMLATLVGATQHTYIAISGSASIGWDAASTSTPLMAGIMLWE